MAAIIHGGCCSKGFATRTYMSPLATAPWDQPIDANGHTIPITYLGKDGKQYVTIFAGGGGGYFGGSPSDSIIGEPKLKLHPSEDQNV